VYALSGMGITALLVASLGDVADVPRHHFLANAFFDLLFLAGCGLLTTGKGAAQQGPVSAVGYPERLRYAERQP
jgi:hypothetical protein